MTHRNTPIRRSSPQVVIHALTLLRIFAGSGNDPDEAGLLRPVRHHAMRVLFGRLEGKRSAAIAARPEIVRIAYDRIRSHTSRHQQTTDATTMWVLHELHTCLSEMEEAEQESRWARRRSA